MCIVQKNKELELQFVTFDLSFSLFVLRAFLTKLSLFSSLLFSSLFSHTFLISVVETLLMMQFL